MGKSRRRALFDDTHGQANWSQTGFPSRELGSNLSGIAEALVVRDFECATIGPRRLGDGIRHADLLILPPPTGGYDPGEECWQPLPDTRLTAAEVEVVLRFLADGGRLLAFAYRFGDSFTGANLSDLFARLGCPLNNDAVFDVTRLREEHPLQLHFETLADTIPLGWAATEVSTVCWRPTATFRLITGAAVAPLVLSPGGRCIAFDRVQRRIRFQSLPIAVAGRRGQGRFVLFGGPHVFETGPFGLLAAASNRRLLDNVLGWLLDDSGIVPPLTPSGASRSLPAAAPEDELRALWEVDDVGPGRPMVAFVEQLLHETGILKALGKPSWMP
ncbi:MAG: hypothetical protein AB7O66_23410 [Limisphaerales bacterium]